MKPSSHKYLSYSPLEEEFKNFYGENESAENEDANTSEIGEHDVLCGRGGLTNSHIGNKHYRQIVADHQNEYLNARKRDKIIIAKRIVSIVQENGGRFLKRSNDGESWVPVSDKKAQEKTSQALREGLDVRNNKIRENKQFRRDSLPAKRSDVVLGKVSGGGSVTSEHTMPSLSEETTIPQPVFMPYERQISQSEIHYACEI